MYSAFDQMVLGLVNGKVDVPEQTFATTDPGANDFVQFVEYHLLRGYNITDRRTYIKGKLVESDVSN